MAYLEGSEISCGVAQLYDMYEEGNPKDIMKTVANEINEINAKIILFSDVAGPKKGGAKLAAFIGKKKLGPLISSRAVVNPNSGNKIKVWMWTVDRKKLAKYETDDYRRDDWD